MNIFLGGVFGSYDYHYLTIGYPLMAYIFGLTGFVGVMGLSILLNHVAPLRISCMYLGKHSLFIMATHEHLMLGAAVAAILASLFEGMEIAYLVVQIIVLMIVELALCKWVEPWCDKVIGKMHCQ